MGRKHNAGKTKREAIANERRWRNRTNKKARQVVLPGQREAAPIVAVMQTQHRPKDL